MAKVLVGEDDDSITELYEIFLQMGGHTVVTATTRKEILDQFELFEPDIVLLDIMLNGADGRDICREIKSLNNSMRVILLSANNHLLLNFDECGADAAIEKPFSLKVVLNKIDELLAGVI